MARDFAEEEVSGRGGNCITMVRLHASPCNRSMKSDFALSWKEGGDGLFKLCSWPHGEGEQYSLQLW